MDSGNSDYMYRLFGYEEIDEKPRPNQHRHKDLIVLTTLIGLTIVALWVLYTAFTMEGGV